MKPWLRALAFAFLAAGPHTRPACAQEQPAPAQVVGFAGALTLRVNGEVVKLGPGSTGYAIPFGAQAAVLAGEAQILVGGALAKAGAGARFAVELSSGQARLAVLSGAVEAVSSDLAAAKRKTALHGGISVNVVSTSVDYPMGPTDYVVLGTGGGAGITITLPSAAGNPGMIVHVKKVDFRAAGAVTIRADGTDAVEGGASAVALTGQYESRTLVSDGARMWYVLASTP